MKNASMPYHGPYTPPQRCACPDRRRCTCSRYPHPSQPLSSPSTTLTRTVPSLNPSPFPSQATASPSDPSVFVHPAIHGVPHLDYGVHASTSHLTPQYPLRLQQTPPPHASVLQGTSSTNSPSRRRHYDALPQALSPSRSLDDGQPPPPKKRRTRPKNSATRSQNIPDIVEVHGVGPSAPASFSREAHPAVSPNSYAAGYRSLLKDDSSTGDLSASDVWYFMRKLPSPEQPTSLPENEPIFLEKPRDPYVGCRLCWSANKWQTWCIRKGGTSTIRKHLRRVHAKAWKEIVIAKGLKGHEKHKRISVTGRANDGGDSSGDTDSDTETAPCHVRIREAFCFERFHHLLVRWIAADDQSINVTECPEFRELLLYACPDLDDEDIPRRTRLLELIAEAFKREHDLIAHDLQNALGRVSFTTDVWTRRTLEAFLAVTAHYMARDARGRLELRARLVGFRYIEGSHAGVHLAGHFLHILNELGIKHKIGMVTLDNASNCGTMLDELEARLRTEGISFNSEQNRIRCFPHVINIAVQAGLRELTRVDHDIFPDEPGHTSYMPRDGVVSAQMNGALQSHKEYLEALENDVVAHVRTLVANCRASGQRRQRFRDLTVALKLRKVQLLRDMDVRWSSTLSMIDRFLELYEAVEALVHESDAITESLLSETEREVLIDICEFLYAPHSVQEILSAERTPTLSLVLPLYENLILLLRKMSEEKSKISHAINVSIHKLEEYFIKSRRTRVYALAMILNPSIKLAWIKKHWSEEDYQLAKRWLREVLLSYRRSMRESGSLAAARTPTSASSGSQRSDVNHRSHASRAQASGYRRFTALVKTYSQGADPGSQARGASSSTHEDAANQEQRIQEEDKAAVDKEIDIYEGLQCEDDLVETQVDLVVYWENKAKKLPLMYRVALDVLPAQASSVPCERVFSSSKETDTLRRSNMSPAVMEILQILKFSIRQQRLSFTDDLLTSDAMLASLDIPQEQIDELISEGKIDQVLALIRETHQIVDAEQENPDWCKL